MTKRKNIGVILAGGSGSRCGGLKQFLMLGDKTVLAHSVDVFACSEYIDEIVIVSAPEHYDKIRGLFTHLTKPLVLVPSGKERYFSTLAALSAYPDVSNVNFLIHDAARPLVSLAIINNCVEKLQKSLAVAVAVPCSDTIFEAPNKVINTIPPRSQLWRAQTPQAFRGEIIKEAFDKALKDPNLQATDDCGIVNRYLPDVPIVLLEGEERNMKITYPEDINVLRHLLELQ
ncbi:MAG: IspD/TarI family cytidylyltransferase [Brevinema sp.]